MGVQNLWVLLAPVGRQIEIESLANKVLAVDASIWLTQFVKAMRDDEGNMIKNAHLIGTFHRVAKLLFCRIKPVFVFDGQTPEIKKRTTARRRKRQEHQAANLKQTAQRILINRLKLQREELKRNGRKPTPAVDPNFVLPDMVTTTARRLQDNQVQAGGADGGDAEQANDQSSRGAGGVIDIDGSSSDEKEVVDEEERDIQQALLSSVTAATVEQDDRTNGSSDDERQDLTVDDIVLDTSRLSKVDLQAVFALPAHLQKDMINRILRDRRQEVRNKFIPLAGQPEAYSHNQIASFLATSALHKRIEAAKKKNREHIEGVEASDAINLGPGKRIASRSDRFFVYKRAEDQEEDESDDGTEQVGEREDGDDMNDEKIVDEIENVSRETRSSLFAVDDSENGFPGLTRFKNNRKRRVNRDDGDEEQGKRTLTDFSVASVKEFALHAQRQQARQWAVADATSAWIAKQEVQSRNEPTLAIEQARQKRLKVGQGVQVDEKSVDVGTPVKQERQSICITFKPEEAEATNAKHLDLFPASMFENAEVKTSKVNLAVQQDEIGDTAERDDDDDDAVEWEDVQSASTMGGGVGTEKAEDAVEADKTEKPESVDIVDSNRDVLSAGDEDEDDIEWEEVGADEIQGRTHTPPDLHAVEASNNAVTSDEVERAEDLDEVETNEMYLSLKNELEDAKAEEDLEELKGEALKSALATASNLTQWAAGAVRRALAAHSQQNKRFVESAYPVHGRTSPPTGSGVSARRAIEIDGDNEEEEKNDGPAVETAPSTSTVIEIEQQQDTSNLPSSIADTDEGTDEYLQLAIAKSLSEDNTAKPSGSRYLQYSTPSPASPSVSFPQHSGGDIVDVASLEVEQSELKKLRNRQLRDVEGFSDEMVEDVMELLRLFGVPYLVCPMEAEAQCAALEQLGLVDGIITDDSDIFPFGGKKVYKNIFHNQKFVEAFFAQDIEKELGFSQEEMIALALLLGSDYTDGIRGIGIVNATEVVNAYPGLAGLEEFKKWVQAFDLAEEAQRLKDKTAKKSESEIAEMTVRERFQYMHASVRRKWELGDEFPNSHVVKAYTNPQVDRSDARFSWSLPDLEALRTYTARTFGWDQQKADGVLLPLMEKAATAGRGVQTRIDQFFTNYDDEVRYAKIQSKRLRSAVESRTKGEAEKKKPAGVGAKKEAAKSKSTPTPKKKFSKKETTLSALGFSGTQ